MLPDSKMPAYYKQGGAGPFVNEAQAAMIRAHDGVTLPYRLLTPQAQMALAQYMAIDGEAWELAPGLDAAMAAHRGKYHYEGAADEESTRVWAETFRKFLPFYVEKYGDEEFGSVEIPTDTLVREVMARSDDLVTDWDAYHEWYMSRGTKHQATEEGWPVILSSYTDEVLQDGWNRFHHYVGQGKPTIPAVWYPNNKD